MKTDSYLSLCLEQAAKSSLHYKHGCIVVNGGKVIGQGYNDYRPGFNGGALKHGRIAKSAFDGPAIAALKEKLKKEKDQSKQQQQSQQTVAFESTGGGNNANIPLSIHSEMMAIQSALAASSTLSSTAFSYEKPGFKLPRSDKRKARLRREVLKSYVKAVCETSQRSGQLQILHHQGCNSSNAEEENDMQQDSEENSHTFHEPIGGLKHQKKKKDGKNENEYQYQYQYRNDRYGKQPQQRQPSACKRGFKTHGIRGYDSTTARDTNNSSVTGTGSKQHSKHKKDYKRVRSPDSNKPSSTNSTQSGKMKAGIDEPSQPEPLLVPTGRTSERSSNMNDRLKHPRLRGADLYVTRLGSCGGHSPDTSAGSPSPASKTGPTSIDQLSSSLEALSVTSSKTTGSLHDELVDRTPSPPTQASKIPSNTVDLRTIRASRPCYRCISYMHSVGIKRVFWTNDMGQWEGAKVRDLVDALDSSMESAARGGPTGIGVFVTKHEVLMLRREMGDC